MAGSSSSAQRVWQSLKPLIRSNSSSLGLASVLTTTAVVGLLLTKESPSNRHTRGLRQLAGSLQLIQAFRADPAQPPPLLWQRRLGVKPAAEIWRRRGRGLWWQGWSVDGEAYLVLPDNLTTAQERLPAFAHSLEDLVVFSADALNQKHLQQRLASTGRSGRVMSPLLSSCLLRLAREPSVAWRPEVLSQFSGGSAPLLQSAGYGCLSLRVSKGHLHWQGLIGSRDLAFAPLHLNPPGTGFPVTGQPVEHSASRSSLPTESLLMVEGDSLGLLLSALASRDIIRRPLEQNYGLNARQQSSLLQMPFRLSLLDRPQSAFRAGLQLQLWPQTGRSSIDPTLQTLHARLLDQGLIAEGSESVIWRESKPSDQAVLGGWRWLQPQSTRPVLSVGLGTAPSAVPLPGAGPFLAQPRTVLNLRVRPAALLSRGLLSNRWPKVVRQAQSLSLQLHMLSSARDARDWTELSGQLELSTAGES